MITFIICFDSATIGSSESLSRASRPSLKIPDDWWVEAGMAEFVRHTQAYRSTTADLVALDDIEPPFIRQGDKKRRESNRWSSAEQAREAFWSQACRQAPRTQTLRSPRKEP
jgi:hypothetical protein